MHLPIRLRLTLTFAVGTALVLTALGAFLYVRLGVALLDSIDMGLRSRAQVIADGVGQGAFADSGKLIDPDEAFAQVLDPAAADPIVESSLAVVSAPMVPLADLESIAAPTFLDAAVTGVAEPARLLVVPVHESGSTMYVVAGATLSDRSEALERFLVQFAIGGPIALALTSTAGWFVAGVALRPVERMRSEAAAISASEPERRLPVPTGRDELARLATTLNEMLERLHGSLVTERRFVDDASHELRTPLTILKGELDLALSRARTPAELEQTLRRASSETDRLARLAEDLLVLARVDAGRLPVRRVDTPLADVVVDACRPFDARARDQGVKLDVRAGADVVRVDPVRLRQAIENLVDNALRHTPSGGWIRVAGDRTVGEVRVIVENSGSGFPSGFLPGAFEPFSRASDGEDDAEGAGLGLAIVRAVAEAHGGAAAAENLAEGGARVSITLRA